MLKFVTFLSTRQKNLVYNGSFQIIVRSFTTEFVLNIFVKVFLDFFFLFQMCGNISIIQIFHMVQCDCYFVTSKISKTSYQSYLENP